MNALALDEFLNFKFLSSLRFSPDGKRAAFVVRECDREENDYRANLWLREGDTLRRLSGMEKESSFFWEDDTHLLFPAVRSAKEKKRSEAGESFTVYYRLATDGGEALPAFELPLRAGELHPMDAEHFYFTATIDKRCPDEFSLSPEEKAARKKERDADADYIVLEEHPFWFNGSTHRNGERTALFTCRRDGTDVKRLTPAEFDVNAVVFTGGKFCLLGESWTNRPGERGGLYLLDAAGGELEELLPAGEWWANGLRVWQGGLFLALTRGETYSYEETPDFYFYDLEKRELRYLREGLSIGNSTGSDCRLGGGYALRCEGEYVYFLSTVRNACQLLRLDSEGAVETLIGGEGSVECFDVSKDGELLCIAMKDGQLQELYTLSDGALSRVSALNTAALAGKYIAPYRKLQLMSEGEEIDGWVLLPKDYDETKSYPAVLDIHGGPRTVYGELYYHEMQYWAGQGYFVFFCNPVGSDGRGDAFADICGGYGQREYRNIMDFTDKVLETYPAIDKARVCVTGGSYGGFMTNWIIGHTDRFCCAATQRSIMNWFSFYGVSDIGILFPERQIGAYLDEPEKMWAQSPMSAADNMKTPTLIIHSDADYRCPIAEGYQLFTCLQHRGVPCRMVVFKGENHELSRSGKPLHRIRRLTEISEWFKKYAK